MKRCVEDAGEDQRRPCLTFTFTLRRRTRVCRPKMLHLISRRSSSAEQPPRYIPCAIPPGTVDPCAEGTSKGTATAALCPPCSLRTEHDPSVELTSLAAWISLDLANPVPPLWKGVEDLQDFTKHMHGHILLF